MTPTLRLRAAVRRHLRGARRVLHAVLGVPDYERYVAHLRAHHPEREPLDRAAFERERLADRYSRPGARCC